MEVTNVPVTMATGGTDPAQLPAVPATSGDDGFAREFVHALEALAARPENDVQEQPPVREENGATVPEKPPEESESGSCKFLPVNLFALSVAPGETPLLAGDSETIVAEAAAAGGENGAAPAGTTAETVPAAAEEHVFMPPAATVAAAGADDLRPAGDVVLFTDVAPEGSVSPAGGEPAASADPPSPAGEAGAMFTAAQESPGIPGGAYEDAPVPGQEATPEAAGNKTLTEQPPGRLPEAATAQRQHVTSIGEREQHTPPLPGAAPARETAVKPGAVRESPDPPDASLTMKEEPAGVSAAPQSGPENVSKAPVTPHSGAESVRLSTPQAGVEKAAPDFTANLEARELGHLREIVWRQITGRLESRHGALPDGEIKISLEPPSLGEMVIRVLSRQGRFTAEIITENAFVKGLVQANLSELQQRFHQVQLPVDRVEVTSSQPHFNGEGPGGREQPAQGEQIIYTYTSPRPENAVDTVRPVMSPGLVDLWA